jgi:hypothetical protein
MMARILQGHKRVTTKMPWTAKDAKHKTKKANTPEKAALWARIANQNLRKGNSEALSIKKANAALKRL